MLEPGGSYYTVESKISIVSIMYCFSHPLAGIFHLGGKNGLQFHFLCLSNFFDGLILFPFSFLSAQNQALLLGVKYALIGHNE